MEEHELAELTDLGAGGNSILKKEKQKYFKSNRYLH